jgi:hypothetical protein
MLMFSNGEAHRWQLVSRSGKAYTILRKGVHAARGESSLVGGAISRDGSWFVTSLCNGFLSRSLIRPSIGIWSTNTGRLVGEVYVAGEEYPRNYHHGIRRLAFSVSGRYLTASDTHYAYLFKFSSLLESMQTPHTGR